MAEHPQQVAVAHGLRVVDVAALGKALGAMLAEGAVETPAIAPAMLLGAPELAAYAARMLPDAGMAMVHESQSFSRSGAVPLDRGLTVLADLTEKGAARVFDFALTDASGGSVGSMQTRLRQVSPEEMARFRGSTFPPYMDKGDVLWRNSRPFDGQVVAAYLALARDPNPIHVDDAAAQAVGLSRAVVPGMFFAGVIESALGCALPGIHMAGMKLRFMAPVLVGESLRFGTLVRGRDAKGVARAVRVFVLREDSVIAAIADLETRAPDQAT